jgi:hypothetical protein
MMPEQWRDWERLLGWLLSVLSAQPDDIHAVNGIAAIVQAAREFAVASMALEGVTHGRQDQWAALMTARSKLLAAVGEVTPDAT